MYAPLDTLQAIQTRDRPRDRFQIVVYPALGDEPWLIMVTRSRYTVHDDGSLSAISIKHLELVPADQAGNSFAARVDTMRTRLVEKYDLECSIVVDKTLYPQAKEQFTAISDAEYIEVMTGRERRKRGKIGRLYVFNGITLAMQQGVFSDELRGEAKATFKKAMTDAKDKPPTVEPIDALISDLSVNDRIVLAVGIAIEAAKWSAGEGRWLS